MGLTKTLVRLLGFLRPYLAIVFRTLALVFVVAGLGVVQPLIVRWAIDYVIGGRHFELLTWAALAIVGVAVFRGLLTFGQRYSMEYMAQRAVFDLRNRLYLHLQQLSFSFYDQAQTGQLMSRLVSDVDTVQRFLGMGFVQLLSNLLTFFAILIILLRMNVFLTLVSLATFPLLAHAIAAFSTRVRPLFWQVQDQMGVLTATLQEGITGIRVVKAFGQEEHEMDRFREQNREYMQRNLQSVRMAAFYSPYMAFLSAAGTSLLLYFGGAEVISGRLTLGSLVAFNSYLLQLVQPVRMLGMLLGLLQRAISSGDRVFEVIDTRAAVTNQPGASELGVASGNVQFSDVWFSYDKRTPVLEGLSFEARAGETVAILGSTGSGKSTVIQLIPRFYDVDKGSVTIDGIDVRDVTLESLRRQVAIVSQETFLFSASIKDNIAYGKPEASMDEIVAAATAAHIHDFVMTLPKRYETVIGERGVGLSGGQKQRVAIARALLMDARMIMLDESTSNVDVDTEMSIQKAFSELLRDRTSFVIAQRLSTVRNADKILVLDKGRIAEEGTHSELLALGGVYSSIYDMQFRRQEQTGHEQAGQERPTGRERPTGQEHPTGQKRRAAEGGATE